MKQKIIKIISSFLAASLLATPISVLAKPKPKPQPKPPTTSNINPIYEKAQKELPKDYFIVYAIVDKIARANGLDNKPWRIVVNPNNEVNASASDVNLLTFNAGLMDQLEGNASALACAIGHEMGHHINQHLGYGPAKEEQAKREEIEKLEKEKLFAEQNAETQALLGNATAIGAAAIASRMPDPTGGLITIFIGQVIKSQAEEKAKKLEDTKAKLTEEAVVRINKRVIEISQTQELEADQSGYIYSVTAGFNPNGCTSVMEILGRMPGAQAEGGSHPAPEKRTQEINSLMTKYPPETLKAQGENALKTKPNLLEYEVFSYQVEGGGTLSGLKVLPIKDFGTFFK